MDAGPVRAVKPAPSWRLDKDVAPEVQGFVVTGFGDLPTGRAMLLEFAWPDGKTPAGWMNKLLSVAPVTNAVPPGEGAQARAASLAFSPTGLRRLGVPTSAMASFSRPFQEGMFQEDRLRRIGDRRSGEWCGTVIQGGPAWSANVSPPAQAPTDESGVPPRAQAGPIRTPVTVHALLLLYAADEAAADAWADDVRRVLAEVQVEVVRRLELLLNLEAGNFSREHFGFADALSQPIPYDEGKAVRIGGEPATASPDPVQGVPLGEFLLGYVNGHHEKAPGPVVPDDDAGRAAALLPPSDRAEGSFDLGLNGSYLVARELRQDVAAFWRSMDDNAAAIRARDPEHSGHVTGEWLAERVVGRDRDGHLLCPGNAKLPACEDASPDSSFRFYGQDRHGEGCPPGSHVRRAFPRDALAPKEADAPTLLQAANNHRILRRGRKFGTKLAMGDADDGADRGLLFMCLNTDIERQFEFVQQTWLLNSSFATLFEEVDPLVGPAGRMTIRDGPLRRVADVDTFVRMAGGDYFFLPGLPALTYLASL